MYPRYNPEGNLDKDEIQQINHKIRDLFTSKIGFVVVDSADTIVISAFLGLTALAIYQNYFYILSSVMGFIADLKEKKSALKRTEKEVASLEAKKAKADAKAAEEAKKAEAESVVKKLLASGMSADEILEKLK